MNVAKDCNDWVLDQDSDAWVCMTCKKRVSGLEQMSSLRVGDPDDWHVDDRDASAVWGNGTFWGGPLEGYSGNVRKLHCINDKLDKYWSFDIRRRSADGRLELRAIQQGEEGFPTYKDRTATLTPEQLIELEQIYGSPELSCEELDKWSKSLGFLQVWTRPRHFCAIKPLDKKASSGPWWKFWA